MKLRDFVTKNFDLLEIIFLLLFFISIFFLLKEFQNTKYIILSSSCLLVVLYWFKVTEKFNFDSKISLISYKLLWYSYFFLPIAFYFKLTLDKNSNYICIIIFLLSIVSLCLTFYDFFKNKVKIQFNHIIRLVISIITTFIIFSLPLPKNIV